MVVPCGPITPMQDEATAAAGGERHLVILHFNDVYNIEPSSREPVGGAARLAHRIRSMGNEEPLVVFSGDAFNPSLLSTITLGAHMPPILNACGVHVAAIGNHDFDFGVGQLTKLTGQCNFPWLMANVLDKETSGWIFQLPSKTFQLNSSLTTSLTTVISFTTRETFRQCPVDALD